MKKEEPKYGDKFRVKETGLIRVFIEMDGDNFILQDLTTAGIASYDESKIEHLTPNKNNNPHLNG